METDRLIEFRVLAEELNYRRAAQILAVSQSSLSRHIEEMEKHLGFRLLSRDRHHVVVTPEGRRLLQQVGDYPERLNLAIAAARQGRCARGPEVVRVGYGRVRGLELIEQVMCRLQEAARPITLELVQGRSTELIGALEHGDIDLAFLRPPVSGPGVRDILLVEETIGAVLRADHPLADEASISDEALCSTPFVTLRPRSNGLWRDDLDNRFYCLDLMPPEMVVEADCMTSQFLLIQAGRGVGLVREAVFRRSSTVGLVLRPIEPPIHAVPLHLAWTGDDLGTARQAVVDLILEARASLGSGYRLPAADAAV